MIAVTFALPAESRDFVRRIRGRAQGDRENRIISGFVGPTPIEVLHTGVGTAIAERRFRKFLESSNPDCVIAAGFAGATARGCSIGDVVLASNFSDPALLNSAESCLAAFKIRRGNLFTATGMIDSASEREEIWSREQAIAIDMETAAIASICQERGVRLLSLRVLSDTPEQPFPLPAHVLFDLKRQRTMARRVVRYLIRQPSSISRLIRFSRQIARARKSLTNSLCTVIGSPI